MSQKQIIHSKSFEYNWWILLWSDLGYINSFRCHNYIKSVPGECVITHSTLGILTYPSLILFDNSVNFTGNVACQKCQKFYDEFRLILHYFHDTKQKVDLFLVTDKLMLDDYGFNSDNYPVILYYRHGIPVIYDGKSRWSVLSL